MRPMVRARASQPGRPSRSVPHGLWLAALLLLGSTALAQQAAQQSSGTTSTTRPRTPYSAQAAATSNGQTGSIPGRTTTAPYGTTGSDPYGQATTTDPYATDEAVTDTEATNPNGTRLRPGQDPNALTDAELPDTTDLRRTNLPEQRLDETRKRKPEPTETPGIRVGTMVLRPSISQNITTESTTTSGATTRRNYFETGLKGTLKSDWSRHELTVTGEGRWQKNIGNGGQTKPSASIDADLRLDISRDTIAHVTAGYGFSREDTDDPNAIAGATQQSGIHRFKGGLSLERDFGLLRGLVAIDGDRWLYSDVRLSDGTIVSLKDRDRMAGTLRGRIGYEISPALIPFIEGSYGKVLYDRELDSNGYARSGTVYGVKAGVALDLSEKMRGELGLGYRRQQFDDARLQALDAFVAEGDINWSPQRGTDLRLALTTTFEPSTAPGESGYVAYGLSAALTHQLRTDLVGRLTGSTTWNRYVANSDGNDSIAYTAGAGLAYGITRYVDLTADLGFERTERQNTADTNVLRAGIGIVTKR